jgi:hypothetical protein
MRLLGNGAVLCLSIVFALAASELLVRVVAPQQLILIRGDIFQPDDTLGWTLRPNVRTSINTGERTVRFATDAQGFRIGTAGRVESDASVLLVGDSFMQAMQVEFEQSLAGLLQAGLSQATGQPVAVRNTGTGGWGPDQYRLRLARALNQGSYTAAIVVLYYGNDIVDYRRDNFPAREPKAVHDMRWPRQASWPEFVDAVLYPLNDYLEVRSQLFILARKSLSAIRVRAGLSDAYFPAALLRRNSDSPMWANTAQICREIADLAKAHGLPLLFVFLPEKAQVDPELLTKATRDFRINPRDVDVDQPGRRLRELLPDLVEIIVDPTDSLRAAARSGFTLYGTVDSHFSPEGHAVVEVTVRPRLLEMLSERGGIAVPSSRPAEP